jgi:hypothetical protein
MENEVIHREREFSNEYINMMYRLFVRCPGVDTRDASGAVHLGEIGSIIEKNWEKATPYSPATRKKAF